MKSPLCTLWQQQVKEFFSQLHGHQSKTLALFVFGAIAAKSIVIPLVAEALLTESEAKVSSIERRLERFVSNERVDVERTWDTLLAHVLPFFRRGPVKLVMDVTSYEEHAQVIYLGLLTHSRVLPLVWKVMPGWQSWEQGLWDCVEELIKRLLPHLDGAECTLMGDSAFGCSPMVALCQKYGWHYLFRIWAHHTCQPHARNGQLEPTRRVSDLVASPGRRFYGSVCLWQEESLETNLSANWDPHEEEALLAISDRPAGGARLREYRLRWRVESTFQDLKSRGWQWERCHVRRLDRIDRLLLVLFLAVWWLVHSAASCMHHGKRNRYDRHDRRDKSILRIGRLYLLDLARTSTRLCELKKCLLLRGSSIMGCFSLRF